MAEGDFILDKDGYYVTKQLFRSPTSTDKCPLCRKPLNAVFAEKYLRFRDGEMMIMDAKIYGYECDSCQCGFPPRNKKGMV